MIQNNQIPTFITGVDDATKCPVIGSIMIAGVVAGPETIALWQKEGVKDSKLITRKKRDELALLIQATATAFSVRGIKPAMIDNKALNLNAWEMVIVCKIIEDLHRHTSLGSIYVDNWEVSEKLFHERLQKLLSSEMKVLLKEHKVTLKSRMLKSAHFIPEHRADENHTIVGAASILAKHASDLEYEKLKKRYGNFGSGSPGDPATRLYVWQHRHNPPPIIRKSWNTFKTLSLLESIEDDWLFIARKNTKNNVLNF
jgi:ribonuclease HII